MLNAHPQHAAGAWAVPVFWLTVLTSASRTAALVLALPWLALQETGSPALVGALGALTLLGGQLMAPVAMLLADRFGRWRSAVAADLVTMAGCLAAALLAHAGLLGIGALMAVAPLLAVGRGMGSATRKALVPDLAEEYGMQYSTVTAGREAMIVAGFIVSPLVSGRLLIDGADGSAVFWLTAGLSAVGLGGMLLLPRRLGSVAHADRGGWSVLRRPVGGIRAAMRQHRALTRAVGITAAVVAVAATFQQVGAPVLAEQAGHDADQAGTLIAGYAAGSVCGVGIHVLLVRLAGRTATVVTSVGVGLVGFALVPVILSTGWMPGAGALVGLALGMTNPLWASATAEYSPVHARGTVVAAQSLASGVMAGLLTLAAGIAVEHLGVLPVIWALAIYWSGCCALWLWRAEEELVPRPPTPWEGSPRIETSRPPRVPAETQPSPRESSPLA